MMFALPFPMIDPIAVEIGPLAIRWYALAYIVGIVLGWQWAKRLAARPPAVATATQFDDLIMWITLGVVLGGRLGYVLFYKPGYYLHNPLEALALWHGGMSFHGGMLGVIAAIWLFARRQRIPFLALGDLVVCAVPIGLFFGRLANFVNAELWGRVSDVPWAMVFPGAGPLARHPSQLYQAFLEGVCLFLLLWWLERKGARARPGLLGGAFLTGYAIARMIGELFRQPDAHLGFLFGPVTMGQLLSLPMLAIGVLLVLHARRRGPLAPAPGADRHG